MAVQSGTIVGFTMLKGDDDSSQLFTARLHFSLPAFGSSDTFSIAAVTTAIANQRRNGKTVTLWGACGCGAGSDGSTFFYPGTVAVSGITVTGQMQNSSGTQVAGSNGAGLGSGLPLEVCVSWLET